MLHMPILHQSRNNSKTLLLTCLYNGHLYDLYKKYSQDIVSSQENFAKFNGWDYAVIGDEINDIYGLTSWKNTGIDARSDCLGMNKWYAMHWVFENTDYDRILLVDFDSKFLKMKTLDLDENVLTLSKLTLSPYYDSVWFLYYCLYQGITFEQIDNAFPFKANSGFIKVSRGFFKRQDLEEFVDFACKTLSEVKFSKDKRSWIHMSDADMGAINNTVSTTLTPFDEVFLIYQMMIKKPSYSFFNRKEYNINNSSLLTDNSVHIHFCTNKEHDMELMCKQGIAQFIE
jgi:hypothetical protein